MVTLRQAIRLVFKICSLSFVILACNKDLPNIASTDHYNWTRKGDTIQKRDTLTLTIINLDSISGKYNFIILPGFDGHSLKLNSDSSFEEYHWADIGEPKKLKGKWKIVNNRIILKSKFNSLSLKIHQYSWATFLIPESKESEFAYEFNRNKNTLDSLKPFVHFEPGKRFDSDLMDFRTLCFIKRIIH